MNTIRLLNLVPAVIPEFVLDAKNLADDIALWLLFLTPVVATIMFIFWNGKKGSASDETEIVRANKHIKIVLVAGCSVFAASGILKVIFSYFQ